MRNNRFLNGITVTTIALSILIVSAFVLFIINAGDMMNTWKKGIRIMAYLEDEVSAEQIPQLSQRFQAMYGVHSVRFIPKDEALTILKGQMKHQASIFSNLKENPLPDAFEIRMNPSFQSTEGIETLTTQLESQVAVDDVEYGQIWLGRFKSIYTLFRLAGFALGSLFFMASVFIVANTIRLVLYSRQEEIEIMRLVGATDGFIKAPFYFEGLILGVLGGVLGLGILFVLFLIVSFNMEQSLSPGVFSLRFLSFWMAGGIIICSMFVGWLGCYLSLKQFLKV